MDMIRLVASAFLLTCFLRPTNSFDDYTDQNRPYEFGFKIDGQQDRYEKKDKNGIIMGQFGFITANDVYHVTVYATDEQGRFKILSMKNIHLKDMKSATSVRQGHSLQIPTTHQVPTDKLTTTTAQPLKKITEEFAPVSLEPPVNSCSHCSIPTTSTTAPKSLLPINQASDNGGYTMLKNNIGTGITQKAELPIPYVNANSFSSSVATQDNSVANLQSTNPANGPNSANGLGFQPNIPSVANIQQGRQQSLDQGQYYPSQDIYMQGEGYQLVPENQDSIVSGNNYPLIHSTQQSYSAQGINGGQSYSEGSNENQSLGALEDQNKPKNSQESQKNNILQTNNAGLNYPQQVSTSQNYESNSETNQDHYLRKGLDSLQLTKDNTNSFNAQELKSPATDTSNVRSLETKNQNSNSFDNTGDSRKAQLTIGQVSHSGDSPGTRTPKQYNENGETQMILPSQKPALTYAQMQIVDKTTNIHAKAPGEKEGLPEGLTKNDMVRLLYTFNYTLGFQGHFEEGYSNGVKQGYYFVTGRNGVKTRIDYTADATGFHPKISQEVLDLVSDDVPKPETEKQAKYGLKGYEFKWLYYPVDSKKR